MPLQSINRFHAPVFGRFLVAIVGQGPDLDTVGRVFSREDFSFAFPRVKIAGWAPTPLPSDGQEKPYDIPEFLRGHTAYPDVPELFAARPGVHLALAVDGRPEVIRRLREIAPPTVTIAGPAAIGQFCGAVMDGRLTIGGSENLRKAEYLFRLLMDQMQDDVFILDDNGIIINMNSWAVESRKVTREEYIGKYYGALDPTLDVCDTAAPCAYCTARNTGKRAEAVITVPVPNGRLRYVHTACFPIQDQFNTPSRYLYVRRDITEQQQLEQRLQQSEKMAAIGELSTYMAHEIRNPLFSIGGFANALLRDPKLDAGAREKARIIFDESRRLDAILTNILNFARPTGQEISVLDVENVIRQTMTIMSMGSDERGIGTQIEVEPNLPDVQGNAENLKQCLINLVKNAFEAMDDAGTLTIHAHRNSGYVRIDVEDTGKGIAPDIQEQVFSPFFSTKSDGAGLGLAMTRKIIEEMGGKVLLKSRLGQGTAVTLLLPAALDVSEE